MLDDAEVPDGPDLFETVDVAERSRFELRRNGVVVAHADYHLDGGVVVIPYVETDPAERGQGLGARLVHAVADHCLERGHRIRPVCSFAAAELRRRTDAGGLIAR